MSRIVLNLKPVEIIKCLKFSRSSVPNLDIPDTHSKHESCPESHHTRSRREAETVGGPVTTVKPADQVQDPLSEATVTVITQNHVAVEGATPPDFLAGFHGPPDGLVLENISVNDSMVSKINGVNFNFIVG